ncbi:response regulator transcription factor [Lysobacter korlensis]|uniref:Response regulator transcription factor n=1 Tax=Lysobacter korlensis TaxID=553636 RepID=A0ABV6RMI9_9GAMM
MIRVAIADDSPLQRAGYRMVLESQPDIEVVGDASDGISFMRLAHRKRIDVALLDVQMPRMNGIRTAERVLEDKRILDLGPRPRVILLASVDIEDHMAAAAAANAAALLYKDVRPEVLLEAIRLAASSAESAPTPRSRGQE